ncbi:hypothetical protein [Chlorobium sp. N1]|nr:hypothetical protein [Chlorobium sp. N1]
MHLSAIIIILCNIYGGLEHQKRSEVDVISYAVAASLGGGLSGEA